ncbi:bifunctional oligoribonuclease/PAP phosphatase NrnA [Candidatus Sumerlaeota bacterium]
MDNNEATPSPDPATAATTETLAEIGRLFDAADRILICGHERPDGDCLGSQVALSLALEARGKQTRMFNAGPIQPMYRFLEGIERIENVFPETWPYDLMVCVDCGELRRVGDNIAPTASVVNIDHHISNTMFGAANYVDRHAAATGELVYHLFETLGLELTREIAVCLMLAIVADTGGFRYASTRMTTFDIAAALTRAGADVTEITHHLFERRPRQMVQLIGEVLCSIRMECDGRLAWSEITQEAYQRLGGEVMEPEGLVGSLRGIQGVEVGCLLHETADGFCRASIRSKGKIDVSVIAQELGGGGHRHASGCFLKQPYAQARELVLATLHNYINNSPPDA